MYGIMIINCFRNAIQFHDYLKNTCCIVVQYILYSRTHKFSICEYTNIFTGDMDIFDYFRWIG